jgi:F-type H+-transporting ATPase subunit delta
VSAEITGATGLAGRYATALFELAEEEKQLDRVAQDLAELTHMIDASPDLKRLLRSPVIARDDQGRAMAEILEKAGTSDLVRNFVGVVARNRRLFALASMIAAYRSLLAARRGEASAEVVSARELNKKQHEAIAAQLRKVVGGKVAVSTRIDAGLLGGLVVKVGSRMFDSSLRTKLQRLRFAMRGIG